MVVFKAAEASAAASVGVVTGGEGVGFVGEADVVGAGAWMEWGGL